MGNVFRKSFFIKRKESKMGNVLLLGRIPGYVSLAASMCFSISILMFILFGSYTRKVRVEGEVQFSQKVFQVSSPVSGVIVRCFVKEGQVIRKGETLYVIKVESRSASFGETKGYISESLIKNIKELEEERDSKAKIISEEFKSLNENIIHYKNRIDKMKEQAAALKKLVDSNNKNLDRYAKLEEDHYFSPAQLQQKVQDNQLYKSRLAEVEGDIENIKSSLGELISKKNSFPFYEKNELSYYAQKITEMKSQLAENEGEREVEVYSQVEGNATAALFDVGKFVNAGDPMASIMPKGAFPIIELYLSSKSIGFVKLGGAVNIRYEAYPYEKFGQFSGKITEITKTPLPLNITQNSSLSYEKMYRVKVNIKESEIIIYGETVKLSDGMKVEADIVLETRKIYEWMIEPIWSLYK